LAIEVIADRIEHRELPSMALDNSFHTKPTRWGSGFGIEAVRTRVAD
jgi:hypothetical protein